MLFLTAWMACLKSHARTMALYTFSYTFGPGLVLWPPFAQHHRAAEHTFTCGRCGAFYAHVTVSARAGDWFAGLRIDHSVKSLHATRRALNTGARWSLTNPEPFEYYMGIHALAVVFHVAHASSSTTFGSKHRHLELLPWPFWLKTSKVQRELFSTLTEAVYGGLGRPGERRDTSAGVRRYTLAGGLSGPGGRHGFSAGGQRYTSAGDSTMGRSRSRGRGRRSRSRRPGGNLDHQPNERATFGGQPRRNESSSSDKDRKDSDKTPAWAYPAYVREKGKREDLEKYVNEIEKEKEKKRLELDIEKRISDGVTQALRMHGVVPGPPGDSAARSSQPSEQSAMGTAGGFAAQQSGMAAAPAAMDGGRAMEWSVPMLWSALQHGLQQVQGQPGNQPPSTQRVPEPAADPLEKRLKQIDEVLGRLNGAGNVLPRPPEALRSGRQKGAYDSPPARSPRTGRRSSPRTRRRTSPLAVSGRRGERASASSAGKDDADFEDEDGADSRDDRSDASNHRGRILGHSHARLPVEDDPRGHKRGASSRPVSPPSRGSSGRSARIMESDVYTEMTDEAYQTTRVEVFRQAADELLAATELEGEQPPQPTLTSSEHFEAWEKWYAGRVNMDTIRAIMKDYQVPVKATATKAIRIVKLIKFFIAHT